MNTLVGLIFVSYIENVYHLSKFINQLKICIQSQDSACIFLQNTFSLIIQSLTTDCERDFISAPHIKTAETSTRRLFQSDARTQSDGGCVFGSHLTCVLRCVLISGHLPRHFT